ncbi:MAG: glycosyltransferase [Planctomycetes bacterium]|nr:glycosyltransferase [Planctomycetota bacterium]
MKIVCVCASFPPEFRGGSEVVVKAQARALTELGHDVRVVCGAAETSPTGEVSHEVVEGLEVTRIARTPAEALAPVWIQPRLRELVAEAVRGADLVHVHHWSPLSGDLVRRLRELAPVVLTLHDHYASCPRFFRTPLEGLACPPNGRYDACAECVAAFVPLLAPAELAGRLAARAEDFRAELRAADEVVAPSEALRDALARELGVSGARWRVVPHGLCRAFASQTREESEEGPLTALVLGNRTRVKGLLELVRGLRDEPGMRLILAGRELEAGLDDELRATAGSLELVLHGSYEASDMRRLARGADLALVPSLAYESYGLVIEEALALGLPVWVSDRGALPEVLARAAHFGPLPGGVLPAGDRRAWRDTLRALVADRDRLQDFAARVPARVRTAADAARDLGELYGDLVARRERALRP